MKKEVVYTNIELDEGFSLSSAISGLFRGAKADTGKDSQQVSQDNSQNVKIPKETPLSIVKQQKLKVGKNGENEETIVALMQKFGISQQTAQALSVRIADYLKRMKIPLAEAIKTNLLETLILEATFADRKAARIAANAAKQKVKPQQVNVAGPKNTKTGVTGGTSATDRQSVVTDIKNLNNEIENLKNTILTDTDTNNVNAAKADLAKKKTELQTKLQTLQSYKDADKLAKQRINTQTKQTTDYIRNITTQLGNTGKVLARVVTQNQKMILNDLELKKMLENPKQFQKFVSTVRNSLARQLKRRGYDDNTINKLLENYNFELNNLLSESQVNRWKVLAEIK
jgi:hypothetical protein